MSLRMLKDTSAFCKENLPELLQEVPLALRRNMYFMQDGVPPHFGT